MSEDNVPVEEVPETPIETVEKIPIPVVIRSYPAKFKCKMCHGKGSLHHVEVDTPKGQYRLGPCICMTKLVKKVSESLAKDEMLDFDVEKDETVKVVVKKKIETKG